MTDTKPFELPVRVYYEDTDAQGVVYYANYFIYFELARLEMFRALRLPYDKRLPIVETSCRYRSSAAFGDLLEVTATLEEVRRGGSPLVFPEQTWTTDGRLLCFQGK